MSYYQDPRATSHRLTIVYVTDKQTIQLPHGQTVYSYIWDNREQFGIGDVNEFKITKGDSNKRTIANHMTGLDLANLGVTQLYLHIS